MSKQQDLKTLVKKYEDIKNSGKLKLYSEEQTKKDFILPLFEILGWDVYSRSEVSAEETISSERVDYGFYLNDRIKFYLEAKRFNVDIHDEKFANQAIKYSFNKGATWAVLTNFETLIVFNAQDIEGKLSDKRFFEINCNEFADRFDQLNLLSKEAFENDLLDKEAEKVGKKIQKISVSNLLYKDLQTCRDILTKDLGQWNSGINPDLLDEGVQKLLDRLLFIRVAEDRGIEPQILIPMVRQARDDTGKHLYQSMTEKFRELDSFYNSNLFSEHPFEQWEEYSGATEKVIHILYGKEGYYEYDFKAMPADVLGTVYENYLSHRLSKSRKGTTVSKDASKRKEQGIYYTPSYIVDYIVKNALGPVLDNCRSIRDIKQIKVLDPACGSGSFLIRAAQLIFDKYKSFGFTGEDDLLKIQILEENIYGVDLDQQAVEITRLNLLISALTERIKFPFLNNIKNGNSLVSGTDEELEKIFGKNFSEQKPFNWQEQFPEVFKQGGFDVIIGNPPYIKEDANREAFDGLHNSSYYQGKMDIWTMFGCVGIDLLKGGGILSFIAPSSWVSNNGASIFRNKILQDGELINYVDFGDYKVFENASIQTMIFGYKKIIPKHSYKMSYLRVADKDINKNDLIDNLFSRDKKYLIIKPAELLNKNIVFYDDDNKLILEKIENRANYHFRKEDIGNGIDVLQDFVHPNHLAVLKDGSIKKGDGIFILSKSEIKNLNLNKEEQSYLRPYYDSTQINRYLSLRPTDYKIIYADKFFRENIDLFPNLKKHIDKFKNVLTSAFAPYGLHRTREERFFTGGNIFLLRKTMKPAFSYVDFPCYVTRAFLVIKPEDVNLKYVLGILNSDLAYFWLKNKGKRQGEQLQIDKEPLLDVPIYLTKNKAAEKTLVGLVDKIISLNEEIQLATENSEKWNSIKSEIGKTDEKINQEVYKLYGLTNEEIKTIEVN